MAAFGTWTGFDTAGLWDAGTGGFDAAGVSPFQPTPSTPCTQKETASAELESLLPSLFEFPVGPPPLATIDAEMATRGCPMEAPRQALLGLHSTLTQSCASRQVRHHRRCGYRQRTTAILYPCPCLCWSRSRQLCRRCRQRPRWSQRQWMCSPSSSPTTSKTGARVRIGRRPLPFPSPGGPSPRTARALRSGKMMKLSPDPWCRHRVSSSRRRW